MIMIGATMADYPAYTIPTEPDVIIWKEPEQDRIFQENEGHKEYVKFQLPDDEYVPLSDLPIVCKYICTWIHKVPAPHDMQFHIFDLDNNRFHSKF